MKKVGYILLLSILIFCCGCSSNNSDENNIIGNSDPTSITEDERSLHLILGMKEDSDYSSIHANSEESNYTLNTEYIACVLTDENVGKGFYYYPVPFIEFKKNGEWIRLFNNSADIQYAEWRFCCLEGNETMPNSCTLKIKVSDVMPEMTTGQYRFVIFTAENMLYAEFQML